MRRKDGGVTGETPDTHGNIDAVTAAKEDPMVPTPEHMAWVKGWARARP